MTSFEKPFDSSLDAKTQKAFSEMNIYIHKQISDEFYSTIPAGINKDFAEGYLTALVSSNQELIFRGKEALYDLKVIAMSIADELLKYETKNLDSRIKSNSTNNSVDTNIITAGEVAAAKGGTAMETFKESLEWNQNKEFYEGMFKALTNITQPNEKIKTLGLSNYILEKAALMAGYIRQNYILKTN